MIYEQMIGEQMIQETNDSGPHQKGAPPPPSCARPLPDPVLCEAGELTRYRLLATGYRLSTAPSLPCSPLFYSLLPDSLLHSFTSSPTALVPALLFPVPCSLLPAFTPPPHASGPTPPIVSGPHPPMPFCETVKL